ncbi:MAG: hypothetical protein V2A77_05420 [Pseudomonadota bacterium]
MVLFLSLALVAPTASAEDKSSGVDSSADTAGGGSQMERGGAEQGPPAAGTQGGEAPAEAGTQPRQMNEVEGEVSGIDRPKKTLTVGGFSGLFGTDLEVTDRTRFVAGPGGAPATFDTLWEGDRIRASYRKVGDKNVAEEVVVLSPQPRTVPGAVSKSSEDVDGQAARGSGDGTAGGGDAAGSPPRGNAPEMGGAGEGPGGREEDMDGGVGGTEGNMGQDPGAGGDQQDMGQDPGAGGQDDGQTGGRQSDTY